jgi:hypothetical protein
MLFGISMLNLRILYILVCTAYKYTFQIVVSLETRNIKLTTSTHVINLMGNGAGANWHAKAPFIAFLPAASASTRQYMFASDGYIPAFHYRVISLPTALLPFPQTAFSSAASSLVPIHGRSGTVP